MVDVDEKYRTRLNSRMKGFESPRYSWWVHWRELSDFILPRRYRWLITPNQWNRGAPLNTHIIDSTGSIAARTLAAGMMAGITSPTRPWFKLTVAGYANEESHPVSLWLAECQRRMYRVFQESNFYNSMAVLFADISVFGSSLMLIDEDDENVIDCYNAPLGEFYLAVGSNGRVNVAGRRFVNTIEQLVEQFGIENCSDTVQRLHKQGGNALQSEIEVAHLIEPNEEPYGPSKRFPFRSSYWEWGGRGNRLLEMSGHYEFPGIAPRWDVTANDPYGRSPGMDALGDIKQLQQEQRRKAQAIDKMVNPPMTADVTLKNQPMSALPGGVTYVTGNNSVGFKPAYEVKPQIREMMEDIQEVQKRIKQVFFNDLFMMFQDLQAEPRSAAAVDVRREEKLIMLGPVLERLEHEGLDPIVDRVFNIMNRRRLFPPAPSEIQGQQIKVTYVSMLAEAQRAAATAGIERTVAFAGSMANADPSVLDNINDDEAIAEYASLMAIAPKIIRDRKEVKAIRDTRAKMQEQERLLQMTQAGAQAAKNLSNTDVGGGINALQAMTGNA